MYERFCENLSSNNILNEKLLQSTSISSLLLAAGANVHYQLILYQLITLLQLIGIT